MIQDNLKKLSLTVALVKSKQEVSGDTYSTKRFRYVSALTREGVDVMNQLHNDLIKYKVPGSPGKECVPVPEQAEPSENDHSLPPEQEDNSADSEPEVLEGNSCSAEVQLRKVMGSTTNAVTQTELSGRLFQPESRLAC